jgi:hypothetical protein
MKTAFKDTKIKEATIILCAVSIVLLIIQTINAYQLKTKINIMQTEYNSLDKNCDFLQIEAIKNYENKI